jgi:thiol-disulfide isomerase/thioredoxin
MRNFVFISCLILFYGCNSGVSQNTKLTDLASMDLKTSFVDLENKKVDLSSFKGKRIIINYWATWCSPCIKEMPALLKAQNILQNHNYIFLLVSNETISRISGFKDDKKYNFNFLKSSGPNEILGIYSLPTSYIFDEKGMKIETIVGTLDWDSDQTIKRLKTL